MRNIIILISLIISFNLRSQISEVDKEELKQGQWKDFYDDGSIKYNGQFINGVEQGLWKFYYQSGELKATKEFFHNGTAAATHIYYKNGNIRASGLYVNKKKDSTWNYFNGDSVLILSEQYKQGQLHGLRKTYYETGEIYIVR